MHFEVWRAGFVKVLLGRGQSEIFIESSTNAVSTYRSEDSGSNGLILTKAVPKFWNNISIYFRKIFLLI